MSYICWLLVLQEYPLAIWLDGRIILFARLYICMATELHDKSYEGWDNFQEIKMQDLKTLDYGLKLSIHAFWPSAKFPATQWSPNSILGPGTLYLGSPNSISAMYPLLRVAKQCFYPVPTFKHCQTVFQPCYRVTKQQFGTITTVRGPQIAF